MSSPGESARVGLSATLLHDLRTPLNQIIGYSEMLAEQAQDEGQDVLEADLLKIRLSGRQLLNTINDSFDVSTDDDSVRTIRTQSRESVSKSPVDLSDQPLMPIDEPTISVPLSGNILVVDDSELNRDVLSSRLRRQGYAVVTVASGIEALTSIQSQSFDLVLLDVMMPDMDGFDVLRHIKNDAASAHIPVVMISALSEVEDVARCISLGADDYLSKPFDPILLKARVGSCLEKKQARDRETQLFIQLEQNFQKLQTLEKQRDDLTNMIVHDLRTPLTSMLGGIQSLGLLGDLNIDQSEMLAISISGGDSLLGIINDLLDIEKMAAGSMKLDYSVVSVPDIIDSAVRQVANLATGKEIVIVYNVSDSMPPIFGDMNKLSRTMVNLLGNAIKFTPPNGQVTVAAQAGPNCESIEVSITDTGEGIPEDALASIFEKFTQVTTRRGGRTMSTGLGLAFCKLAIEAHGGKIDARSEMGLGSAFTFNLPCSIQ